MQLIVNWIDTLKFFTLIYFDGYEDYAGKFVVQISTLYKNKWVGLGHISFWSGERTWMPSKNWS